MSSPHIARRSRRWLTLTLLALAAAVLPACDVLQAVGPNLDSTSAAPSPPTPTGALAGDWYTLYFTTPDSTARVEQPSGGIPAAVIASFDAARTSIDLAMYEFTWEPLADALVRALARGVRVRLVTDTDSLSDEAVQRLRDAGVPVVDDGRAAIMHDKFAVVDGSAVWTGSLNFTRNDAYRNDNVFIQVRSTRLAENYTAEFEEMFVRHAFGPQSPADTPNPIVNLNGTEIESYFSPEDGVARHILSLLNGAQRSIYFMAFSFTRQDFAEALLARAGHGVTVKGVFEASQLTESGDLAWSLLTGGGLATNVRQDGNPYNLHTKAFIVDEATVVLGSYNFSRNAEESNDENVLILHNPDIARSMLAEWQRVWDKAGD